MRWWWAWGLLVGAAAGCASPSSPDAPDARSEDPLAQPSVAAGQRAFVEACASCHAARDGFDLAYFSFPDSTIVRRALGHVDSLTANDIAAYIGALDVASVHRDTRVFQPGSRVLHSDGDFALELFGEDAWPDALGSEALLAIDPTGVAVAITAPPWSHEERNVDWLPDAALDEALLDARGGAVRGAIASYYASGSAAHLLLALDALQLAGRDPHQASAPCVEEAARFRGPACFDLRRWTATLSAQHMFRSERYDPFDPRLHDAWWDAGSAGRVSLQVGQPIAEAETNAAVWMYLAWSYEPARYPPLLLPEALHAADLPRHATFVALRSMVERPERLSGPYQDLQAVATLAPDAWLEAALRFAYGHLIERLEAGDTPDPELFTGATGGADGYLPGGESEDPRIDEGAESQVVIARRALEKAWEAVQKRRSGERLGEYRALDERIRLMLPPLEG